MLLQAAVEVTQKGDGDTARALAEAAGKRRNLDLAQFKPAHLETRLVGSDIAGSIGHISMALATRMRLENLGLRAPMPLQLKAARSANDALLSYFVDVVAAPTSDREEARLQSSQGALFERILCVDTNDGPRHIYDALSLANQAWEALENPPLLTLADEHEEQAISFLRSCGFAPDAWFVGLHVREDSSSSLKEGRNASINDYLPMVERITGEGGWVIRIGDRRMPPMPPMPRVIDLTRTAVRPPAVDIFVCAKSRFFVGTSSGPSTVPSCFGVPILWSNATGVAFHGFYLPKCRIVPKLLLRDGASSPITLEEMVHLGIAGMDSSLHSASKGSSLKWVDNSPDLLDAAAAEMLSGSYNAALSRGQISYQDLLAKAGNWYRPVLASSFIDRYPIS